MEGYEVEGAKGERAWWDGQRIVPLPKQDSEAKLTADMQKFDAEKVQPEQQRQQAEFARLRQTGQQSAIQEPAFQKLAGATIPAAATAASFLVPGSGLAGLLTQGALSGGATAANQALGFEPKDATQVGIAAALPAIAKGAVGAGKSLVSGAAKLVSPGIVREAATDIASKAAGQPGTFLERVFQTPASKAAFQQARANVSDVPLAPIGQALSDSLQNAKLGTKVADSHLKDLVRRFQGQATAPYESLLDEAQNFEKVAQGLENRSPASAKKLRDVRQSILDAMDKISPDIKNANAIYRQEQIGKEVTKAMRAGNPAKAISEFFEADTGAGKTLGAGKVKFLKELATEFGDVPAASPEGGMFRSMMSSLGTLAGPMLMSDMGQTILKSSMVHGKPTAAGLAAAASFYRAYQAQSGGK